MPVRHFPLAILMLVTVVVYYPALDSRFMLDDFYNLAGLAEIESYGYAHYILSGFAGPSGRPLSLVTFALQYTSWPQDVMAFKLVNLLIHLCNGLLIWIVARLLFPCTGIDKKFQLVFASLVTGLWLLHPIQYSTVLYTVQRMTQLSALFTLAGIIGYLVLRLKCASENGRYSSVVMMVWVGLCTLLAILCKENGILLPLYILVLELTLLPAFKADKTWRVAQLLVLVLPLLILAGYLLVNLDSTLASYKGREFSVGQRLLTEANVLFTYIGNLLLPAYGNFSLYHDDFPVAESLFNPVYTGLSVSAVLLLFISACLLRKQRRLYSFAVLWFVAGHCLEASFLNLELYFEHRNYLPSISIFVALSVLLIRLVQWLNKRLVAYSIIAIYALLITTVSVLEARSWSRPFEQTVEWVRLKPESRRALTDLAAYYVHFGEYALAIDAYKKLEQLDFSVLSPAVAQLRIRACLQGQELTESEWQQVYSRAASASDYEMPIVSALDSLVADIIGDRCHAMNLERFYTLLTTIIGNRDYWPLRDYLYEFIATLKLYEQDYQAALASIRKSLEFKQKPSRYMYEIRLLKIMGKEKEADERIHFFKQSLADDPRLQIIYTPQLNALIN